MVSREPTSLLHENKPAFLVDLAKAAISPQSGMAILPNSQSHFLSTEPNKSIFITPASSIEEHLFEALSGAKVLTSQVAMHLTREWRDILFRKLDRLHDVDEWEEDDAPLQSASLLTFLRTWFALAPKNNPSLGLSNQGLLIAVWDKDGLRLSLTFFPQDKISWAGSIPQEDYIKRIAGITKLDDIRNELAPYEDLISLMECQK